MKKLLLLLLMIVGCSVAQAQYYLSPTGSDSNNGTSTSTPWLTPNHAMTCGQTITAAAGTYSSANFGSGKWGTVSCPSANNVAWLQCATFDACKISSTNQGMYLSSSFWGVTGFEVTSAGTYGTCFNVQSAINHIIFANDVANGCQTGGFSLNNGDYFVIVGNIAYNAAQGSAACTSGISIYEPQQSDTNSGTHMYVAGNFSYSNVNPSSCAGTAATDGEGIIFDTFNHEPYTQQVVAQNNILLGNGGRGIEVNNNTAATFYFKNNTAYGNNNQSGQLFPSSLGDLTVDASNVTATGNIAMTSQASVSGNAIYAFSLAGSSNTVSGNWLYSAAGNTTTGSGYGSNTTGTSPAFSSTAIPGAPSCSGQTNTVACAATIISNFTPTASGTGPYGHQAVSNSSVTDALFPQWLCSGTSLIAGFPSGLVTPGCGASTVNPSMSQAQVQAAINAKSSGQTATFAPGTYTLTSTLNIPCGVSLSGPVVSLAPYTTGDGYTHMGYTPTATIQGNLGETPLVTLASCSTAQSVKYLGFNGEVPTQGGGGLYVPGGNSNLTVEYNYFYGNQTTGTACCGAQGDTLLYMDGSNPATNDQNVTISWNRFGASGNCSNIMANVYSCNPASQNCTTTPSYQGSSAALTGGYCGGVGIHTGATNLLVDHNVFYSMEQGIKHFSGTNNNTSFCNLCTFENNDFSNIHRIGFETQINPGVAPGTGNGSAETIQYNSYHDTATPFYGTFGISAANGTSTQTNSTYNLLAANISPLCCGQPSSEYIAMADELWGSGSSTANNWIQGYWANGVQYNYSANFTISGNQFCGAGTPSGGMTYISRGVPSTYGNVPTVSSNTPGTANTINGVGATTCTVTASTAPTIYPPAGSYTFPQTVTLSNAGVNTSTWYTTDGSTPVPGTGTAQIYSGPFVMATAGTVKAVGMWGAPNQPTTYASGYGFAPSSVVSAAYTGSGGTPTAATPVMSPTSQSFTGTLTVSVSDSTAGATIYCTTNGTTPTTTSPVYSAAFSVTATTTIQCIATATGYLQSAVGSGSYTLNTPTLTGGYLSNSGSINTLTVGAPAIQFTAEGTYSDSVTRPLPDSFGNTAVWSSSNTGILTVGSTGLVSCAAAGSANVQVTSSPNPPGIVFNVWGMTCTGSTPTAATPVMTPVSQTFTGTLQVTIADSTGGSTIYYTTNGTTPTTSSTKYTGTFNVTATTTVQAIATAPGYNQSAIGSATYMLQAPTISTVYLSIPGNLNYTTIGATVPFHATIKYSDGVELTSNVVGTANTRGDSISSWTTSASGVATIDTNGVLRGVALGTTHIQAVINGSVPSSQWYEYVSASASTVTKGTTTKGVTIQ